MNLISKLFLTVCSNYNLIERLDFWQIDKFPFYFYLLMSKTICYSILIQPIYFWIFKISSVVLVLRYFCHHVLPYSNTFAFVKKKKRRGGEKLLLRNYHFFCESIFNKSYILVLVRRGTTVLQYVLTGHFTQLLPKGHQHPQETTHHVVYLNAMDYD